MRVAFLVLVMPGLSRCDISLPELEFLVGQMSFGECQHLADALREDSGASNVDGVTCLDELIRCVSSAVRVQQFSISTGLKFNAEVLGYLTDQHYSTVTKRTINSTVTKRTIMTGLHYALKNEGPNIVRGVFKHKLNQIGRRDLAQWLSIEKEPEVLTRSKNGAEEEQVPIEGKTGPLGTSKGSPTSWCEIAVTIALLYTGALLVWLTVRVVLCKMKKHFSDKGGYGYSYYPPPQHWQPTTPHWSPPGQQWSPPGQQWSSPPPQARAVPSQHHYHPPPTSRPTTSVSQPQMARHGTS